MKLKYLTLIAIIIFIISAFQINAKIISQNEYNSNTTINEDIVSLSTIFVIDSVINGKIYSASESAYIEDTVNGNVMLIAENIIVTSNINGNLLAFANTIEIAEGVKIEGDFTGYARRVVIKGNISKNTTIGASEIKIWGNLNNAELKSDSIYLAPNSELKTLKFTSENQIRNLENVESYYQVKESTWKGFIYGYLSFFLVGCVLLNLPWMKIKQKITIMKKELKKSLWVGLLIFLISPLVMILLFLTIFGIPLALLLIGFYVGFLYIAKIYICIWIGKYMLLKNKYLQLAAGWFIVALVFNLPYVGWIFGLFTIIIGFGVTFISSIVNIKKKV